MSTDFSLLKVYSEFPQDGLNVTFRFYQDPPNISGGGGGWEAVARPLDTVTTSWRGPTDGYTMELSLILDCFTAGKGDPKQDIEDDCRTLEKMYGALTSPVVQPPLLVLDANGALQNDVYNFPPLRWVISEPPTYGDVLRNAHGRRTRQVVTVKFMKYTSYDELTRSKDASQNAPRNTFTASATVNTFKKAAAKFLKQVGGAKWATRLANLNGQRDPTKTLLPGRIYKLPTGAQIKQWEKTSRR